MVYAGDDGVVVALNVVILMPFAYGAAPVPGQGLGSGCSCLSCRDEGFCSHLIVVLEMAFCLRGVCVSLMRTL